MFGNLKVLATMGYYHLVTTTKRRKYHYKKSEATIAENRRELYKAAQVFSSQTVKASGMNLKVLGKENLPEKGPVVYMASHKSVFDILILMKIIDDPCIYIGKKELNSMPIVNAWFEALGCLYIDREDKRQALQCIMKGISELKAGQSIVVFPEGTRMLGDEIGTFKGGSFKLATKSGVPIVPIALHNTYKVLEESKSIKKVTVTVNIGKVINPKELGIQDEKLPSYVEKEVRRLMNEVIDSK